MKSEVMFRDLPGGPLLVKFADGVSLWCLCSKCGMYSKDMFQDAAPHAFCSVCIFECGERKMILCKQENRDVPVDEMVRAVDIRHVMRDKIVFCPNSNDGNGCDASCALKDLEDHYIECAGTNIACLSCGSVVKGPCWERHINTCPQGILQCRYCDVTIPRSCLEAHEKLCCDNQDTRQRPKWTPPVSHPSDSCSPPSPGKDIKANMDNRTVDGATAILAQPICNNVDSDESLLQCIYCKRHVKRKNMKVHNRMCAQKQERSTVSAVGNIPGNIQAEDALQSSLVQRGVDIASAVTTYYFDTIKGALQVLRDVSGSDPMKTETAEGSGVVPGVTSCSSAANRLEGSSFRLSWPAEPSYRKLSEWFDHFEAWLERNGVTTEERKFPLLLNKIPEVFADALLDLYGTPNAYSEAKLTVIHNFKTKDRVK